MIPPSCEEQAMWCSYMPALGYALGKTTGSVLEIGVGHFSTPFLHEYCRAHNRYLNSIESDDAWREKLSGYASDFHVFGKEPSNDRTFWWGVVFIDNSPGGEARLRPFLDHIKQADFVVVHDYHRENEEAIKPHLEGLNYKVYNQYQPPTLLASKFNKIN